jgi:hypothetical protein
MKTGHHVSQITLHLTGLFLFTFNVILNAHGDFNVLFAAFDRSPVLDNIESDDLLYTKGDGRVTITGTLTITEENTKDLSSATIRITSGFNAYEDILRFSNQNRIFGHWNQSTGILSLTGKSSIENYQRALRSIQYENTNTQNPSATTRVVSFMVNDGHENSNVITRRIVRNTPNTAPALTNIEAIPVVYCINSGAATVTSTIRVSDSDNANLNAATVQITAGYNPSEDFLRFTSQNGITGSWAPSTGKLTLSGATLIANYQTALRSIRYENTNSVNPHVGNRVISFTVSDGKNVSNTVTGSISVNGRVNAVLTGSASICSDDITTAPLSVNFSGTPPWKFSYRRDTENPIEVLNVLSSPRTVSVRQAGTYTLLEVYDSYCKGTVSGSAVISVIQAPDPVISGLDPTYDKGYIQMVPIFGTPSGGTFTGPELFFSDPDWFFFPSQASVGMHNIIYAYQSPSTLCYGYDTAVVRVLEAAAVIEFENNRINYCENDLPFTVTGVNLAGVIGNFTIEGGVGLVDHNNNTATVYPSQLSINPYTITYSYYGGTTLSVTGNFNIGKKLIADFAWESECYQAGQSTLFKNTSISDFGNLTDTSYHWKVYTATGFIPYTTRNITYTFPRSDNYNIELQLQNTYGCTATITKTLPLRRIIALADQIFEEDFETKPIEWQSNSSSTVNSWELGTPSKHDDPSRGFSGAFSGENCWYTYIPTNTVPPEQSWVTSPCFDFTGTEKPMLIMNIWRLFNDGSDGANLQASSDSGKTWLPVGQHLNDGINWFNDYYGNPDAKSLGWSGIKDAGWIESRHSLDVLKNKTKVQFRIAYGATGDARYNDGIAFDNFRIAPRNRMSLIEHFTNSSDNNSADADSILNELVNKNSLNVVDLQYHTSNPPNDPIYDDNQVIPTARAFYYGLSAVPYSILDGGSTSLHRFDYSNDEQSLDENAVILESLRDSKFEIQINSQVIGNTLYVQAQVSSRVEIPLTGFTLHIAVIEQAITGITGNNGDTSFESVVKTMLPGSEGTPVYKAWSPGESHFINKSWNLQNVYNPTELRVVAFIQNESTYEIYQAAIDTIGVYSIIDNLLPESPSNKSFIVYPNPAERSVQILFNKVTEEDITIELFNNPGGLVYKRTIPEGTDMTDIPVENYPDGLYIIRLVSSNKLIGINKLTISK